VPLADNPGLVAEVSTLIAAEWMNSDPDSMNYLQGFLLHPDEGNLPYTLVALANKKVIGTVSIFRKEQDALPEHSPRLAALIVSPGYRRRGIGSRLVDQTVSTAKQLGIPELFLGTGAELVDFYRKRGWQVIGENSGSGITMRYSLAPVQP